MKTAADNLRRAREYWYGNRCLTLCGVFVIDMGLDTYCEEYLYLMQSCYDLGLIGTDAWFGASHYPEDVNTELWERAIELAED